MLNWRPRVGINPVKSNRAEESIRNAKGTDQSKCMRSKFTAYFCYFSPHCSSILYWQVPISEICTIFQTIQGIQWSQHTQHILHNNENGRFNSLSNALMPSIFEVKNMQSYFYIRWFPSCKSREFYPSLILYIWLQFSIHLFWSYPSHHILQRNFRQGWSLSCFWLG